MGSFKLQKRSSIDWRATVARRRAMSRETRWVFILYVVFNTFNLSENRATSCGSRAMSLCIEICIKADSSNSQKHLIHCEYFIFTVSRILIFRYLIKYSGTILKILMRGSNRIHGIIKMVCVTSFIWYSENWTIPDFPFKNATEHAGSIIQYHKQPENYIWSYFCIRTQLVFCLAIINNNTY